MLSGIFCFPDEIYLETMNPGWGTEILNQEGRKEGKGGKGIDAGKDKLKGSGDVESGK